MGKKGDRKHDETYRSLFMHVELIEELLRRFADTATWIDNIDFDKARTLPTEFISDRLVERRSDLIWELPTHGGKTLYVAILIEFQSSPQEWMAVRMLVYVALFYDHLRTTRKLSKEDGLPPVFPIVVYNNAKGFDGTPTVEELINLEKGSALWNYQPSLRYHLVDAHRLDAERLNADNGLVAHLFKLEQVREPFQAKAIIGELAEIVLADPVLQRVAAALGNWIEQALKGLTGIEPDERSIPIPFKDHVAMLVERVEQWQKDRDLLAQENQQAQAEAKRLAVEAKRLSDELAQEREEAKRALHLAAEREALLQEQNTNARKGMTNLYIALFKAQPEPRIVDAISRLSAGQLADLPAQIATQSKEDADASILVAAGSK